MTPEQFHRAIKIAKNTTSQKGLKLARKIQPSKGNIDIYVCAFCRETFSFNCNSFTDELSVKEFFISGMCQKCQDLAFLE